MRDLIVTLIVFGGLPYTLARPHVGIYLWSWIGYMNPHRLSWGFAAEFPFAMIIALFTIMGLVLSKEPKRIPMNPAVVVLIVFILWMVVTTFFASNPELAWPQLSKVIKIQLMSFIIMMVLTTRDRLQFMIWVIVVSLGFFGLKGGVFTILTGGQYMVVGPPDTFIQGNTTLALALIMIFPLIRYLHLESQNSWMRRGLMLLMGLTAVAIVGSYSRGAFLAFSSVAFFLIFKSKNRVALFSVLVLLIPFVIMFMPDKYTQKIETIQTYQEDRSALGRLGAWEHAYNVATQRFTGGGYEVFLPTDFQMYSPQVFERLMETTNRAASNMPDAHSIYFEVLGEHGFIGLGLFLLIGIFSWRNGAWVIRRTSGLEELTWARNLAGMVQVSLIGYAVGGAFLGLAYFDLYYHLVAILVVLRVQVQEALQLSTSVVDSGTTPVRST